MRYEHYRRDEIPCQRTELRDCSIAMHVTSFAPGPYTGRAHMCVPLYGMCGASSDLSYSTARSVVPRKVQELDSSRKPKPWFAQASSNER